MKMLGTFVCLATLLPLIRAQKWWIRIFDFPRLQIAALGAVVVVVSKLRRRGPLSGVDRVLLAGVKLAVAGQLLQIYRYTPLARSEVLASKESHREATVGILIYNVLMSNRRHRPLVELVRECRPDLFLLLEPDGWWDEQMEELGAVYPHRVRLPLGNTYGLLLYSKLELLNPEVRYLVQQDVPSVRTQIRLRDGQCFWFYGVHPKPPGRLNRRYEIRGSEPRDEELVRVAKEVAELGEPVIVAGDFNDVAWSHTTRLFQRISRLLDPRVGRGFYNSFHAEHPLVRFPLDHLFHSEHFTLSGFKRLPKIGSDHFPIYVSLALSSGNPLLQEPPPTSEADEREAQELMRQST